MGSTFSIKSSPFLGAESVLRSTELDFDVDISLTEPTSPVGQWLIVCFPPQKGAGSLPVCGTKIPYASQAENQNVNNRSHIVPNSVKT